MQKTVLIWALAVTLPLVSACSGEDHGAGHDGGTIGGGGGTFSSIPNPALVVANGGEGTVSIIDPATLGVVSSASVASGLHPHHISLAPDRSRVLVTAVSADLGMGHSGGGHGSGSSVIYQLDVASKELTGIITADATAHNAAFTPDGETIVFGMMEHGMVVGHNASTFEETFSVSGFDMPLEVTPTNVGSLLVAESGAGQVALLDLASQTVSMRFDVGAVPVAAWASGGSNYFVSVEEGEQLRHFVEGDTNITLDSHTIDLTGVPGQAILTPNGAELWVAIEDRGVLAVFDATTHEKLAELAAGTKPHGIAFEPSGARAFVTDEEGARVLVIDVAGRSVSSEITVGAQPNGIAWLEW